MKKLISDIIAHNEIVLKFLETANDAYQDGREIIPQFEATLQQTQYNPVISNAFSAALQFSNDKAIYEQFDLTDISRLYRSLLKLQDFNLETYCDAAYFELSVLDNPKKAKSIAEEGISKGRQKVEELQKLLDTLNN